MYWIILILAGMMEVGFTFCLGKTKTATGQELIWWWLGFLGALALSMTLMAKAAEKLPIGTVYPVWTDIGAVGAVVVGILFFHEPASFWRIFFITTLILSIIEKQALTANQLFAIPDPRLPMQCHELIDSQQFDTKN